jgi:hypothetical protein
MLHVLGHISNDDKAISGIRRILKINGFAIFHIPVAANKTVEYSEVNPNEA